MIMYRLISICIIILSIAFSAVAQDKLLVSADAVFDSRDYLGAISLYKKALRKTDDFTKQQHIAYQIGLSYYQMNDYENSADWFEDAIGDHTNDAQAYLYYAQVLAAGGKYIDAKNVLQKAQAQNPLNKQIQSRIEAIDMILDKQSWDSLGIVSKVPGINSSYSDYSVGNWNGGIVFSSTRKEKANQRTDGRTGHGFSDLYYTNFNNGKLGWSNPKTLSKRILTGNNEGTFTFDSVNNIAYWTTCFEKPNGCLIYSSTYIKKDEKWSKPEKLSFMNTNYNYGHPYISEDGNTLYFTSNLPGGYGNKDLWKVRRKTDGFWGVPINLGENVNTSKNEVFPSVYGDTLLFFSSDAINSLGGLDLFFSIKKGLEFDKPTNVGVPINSAADDFCLVISKNSKGGYFSSNRDLSTSDDIYQFTGFPIKLSMQGMVAHEADITPIPEAMIISTNEFDFVDTVFTASDGSYKMLLDAYQKYRLTVVKDGYFNYEKIIETSSNELIFRAPPQLKVDFHLSKKSYPCGIKGIVTNRETNNPISRVVVSLTGKGGFSTYVKTNNDGSYLFEGLKPNTIYTLKTGEEGFFSESRVCTLPKVKSPMVFSKENGYDMDFQLLQIQTNNEIALSNIYYDLNKATLRETSKIELDKLASMLVETPDIAIQINAHSDSRGKAEYNLRLSADRANSVVNYLVSKGVDRGRLIAKGYGESILLINNARNEDEHQANRRTTFNVIDDSRGNKNASEINKVDGLVYRIQLLSTGIKRDVSEDFDIVKSKLDKVNIYQVDAGTLWKYEVGDEVTFKGANQLKDKLRTLGYSDCFVISYYKGSKIPISQAKKMEGGEK